MSDDQPPRKLAPEELGFLAFAQSVGDVVYVLDSETKQLEYVSPAYERVFQRAADELYRDARAYLGAIHPEDRSEAERALTAQAAGQTTDVRYRLLRADGTIRHIRDRAFMSANPLTGKRRIVGIADDITEAVEAQRELVKTAQTFEALVRDNPFGIYVIDGNFRLRQISRGAQSIFARIEPLIGRDYAEILRIIWAEPFATEAIERFRHTLVSGEPYISYNTTEARANVEATEAYDWRIERIRLPDGSLGVVCYFYDLSERMAFEDQLRQALADKDLLIREVDHRVRNNLAMIASLLQLQRTAVHEPETKRALDAAAARVLSIARMHELLYKSDRIGVVDFGSYLEMLCADLERTVRRPDLAFEVRVVPIGVSGDIAVPLGIIANELITNACKHCPDGEQGRVTIDLVEEGQTLVLTISNTGPGMATDFAPTRSRGLGLRVIDVLGRHVGAQLVYPEPGEAAQFEIRVPLGDAAPIAAD